MSVQENGITVVGVNNEKNRILFYVGHLYVRLQYQGPGKRFQEIARGFIDGRRIFERCRVPEHQHRAMIRQAHAIARERGW